MGLKLVTEIITPNRKGPGGPLSSDAMHDLEQLLCSWGLGDRQAMVLSAWLVADAVRYRAGIAAADPQVHDRLMDMQALAKGYADIGLGGKAAPRASRCLETCRTQEDVRQSVYALAVARIFAKATGADLEHLGNGAETAMFENLLFASLKLIDPLASKDMARALRARTFGSAVKRLHA
jgi:hypothetical protein